MKKLMTTALLMAFTLTIDAQTIKKGDLNGDNQVSISDVMMLIGVVISGLPEGADASLYDINRDQGISISDVMDLVDLVINNHSSGDDPSGGIGDTTQAYLTCPDDNHPHMIDLGLRSGTKWACCNVGATTPCSIGGYYAWGETEEKDCYDKAHYKFYDNATGECTSIGNEISGTQYDVAHVKWKGPWQMPTNAQQEELLQYCKDKWVTINGVNGHQLTGPNGGSIFLPDGGWYDGEELYSWGDGWFWSGTSAEYEDNCSYAISYEMAPGYYDDYTDEWIEGDYPVIYFSNTSIFSGSMVRPVVCGLSKLEISNTIISLHYGEERTVNITSGNGTYAVASDAPDVASATIEGNYIHITAVGAGTATITVTDTKSGETANIKVTSEFIPFILSSSNHVLITEPENVKVQINSGYGKYRVESSNPGIATAKIEDGYLVIIPVSDGEATITVTDLTSGESVVIRVKVQLGRICPDDHHPHQIDLGLPSGTKWSCCNIGATTPTSLGSDYAWGDTEEYVDYNNYPYLFWKDYEYAYTEYDGRNEYIDYYYDAERDIYTKDKGRWCCSYIGNDISGTQYDVARSKWGGDWQIPSFDQIMELCERCHIERTNLNGTNGLMVTALNDSKIFIPEDFSDPVYCHYWLSEMQQDHYDSDFFAYALFLHHYDLDEFKRCYTIGYLGRPFSAKVRPVTGDVTTTLSTPSLTMSAGEQTVVKVTKGSGNYSVASDNVSIATATINGGSINVTAVGEGSTVITVTDNGNGQIATTTVTVRHLCPDDNHPHLIDLGLPSGTKWACCNVETIAPHEYGGYYAWGETEVKNYYWPSNYSHCQYNGYSYDYLDIGHDIQGTEYDVAHVKWGGSWTMPSDAQIKELLTYCSHTKTTIRDNNGFLFTGTNGNSIFLPAAGNIWTEEKEDGVKNYHSGTGLYCDYWSSNYTNDTNQNYSNHLDLGPTGSAYIDIQSRTSGLPVRPVAK